MQGSLQHDRQGNTIRVVGCRGGIPASSADLYVSNSGTTVRFLTGMAALGRGEFLLHGSSRMHERPIKDLLAALEHLGVDAVSENSTGCPPVLVRANGIPGGTASIAGDISSVSCVCHFSGIQRHRGVIANLCVEVCYVCGYVRVTS